MRFIAQSLTTNSVETNVLTDGKGTCNYAALAKVFDGMRTQLQSRDIDRDVCLAFECGNSLLSAIILLFLLEEGHDFFLMPAGNQGCKSVPVAVPPFCAYRLAPSQEQFTEVEDSDHLNLTANAAYRKGDQGSEPRLYVRTSGSTGTPKLAVHTHRSLRQNARNCLERLQMESTDRVAIPVPLSHMYGLGAAFLPAVAVGASIDLQHGANLMTYIARERDFQPNRAFVTPTFCESLVRGRKVTRPYKLTVTAGDRLRGDTFDNYESRYGPLVQLYGSTELGAIAAASPDDPAEVRALTVGRPLADVEVRLQEISDGVDAPGEDPSENGQTGELWCRHAHGFLGYADEGGELRPGTQLLAGGWFPMHDLGRIGPDGRIQVRGRSDHAVNRSGLLVLFADIEATMMTVPGIDKAVVVASGESDYGAGLAAFCIATNGAAMAASDVHAACLQRMPRREVPDIIVMTSELPLLPSGKIDRQALIQMATVANQSPVRGSSAERTGR